MTETIHKKDKKQNKLSFFDYGVEIIGWLKILASPLLVGIIIGGLIYLWIGGSTGIIIGISVTVLSLIIGIAIANRISKRNGTIYFTSRVNASPDLDNLETKELATEQKQSKLMVELNDWRLQGQEKYLKGAVLFYKNYAARKTKTDHDHCEFCGNKFSDIIPDALKEGYTTADDYRWICSQCFDDFKEMFNFKIGHTLDK